MTKKMRNRPVRPTDWTDAEDAILREHYPAQGATGLPELLARSRKAILLRASMLGVTKRLDWTEEQDAILREHYVTLGSVAVSLRTGRSVFAVRHRAAALQIKADPRERGLRSSSSRQTSYAAVTAKRERKHGPKMTVVKTRERRAGNWDGDALNPHGVKPQVCRPFVDTRFVPTGPIPRVVDSAQCRAWAAAL